MDGWAWSSRCDPIWSAANGYVSRKEPRAEDMVTWEHIHQLRLWLCFESNEQKTGPGLIAGTEPCSSLTIHDGASPTWTPSDFSLDSHC